MSMVVRATWPGGPEVLEVGSENPAGPQPGEALVHQTAILFPSATTPFAGTTYSVPNTTTRQIITGLTPGAGYTVGTLAI